MKDRISQLMDGELDDRAAADAIQAFSGKAEAGDSEARDTWRLYHLIGDAMRDTPVLSAGFAARVSEKLAAEPTVISPNRIKAEPRNWFALPAAAAASLAAVGLVGWLAFGPEQGTRPAAVAVQAPAALPVIAAGPARIPLPLAMPDYLFAHQGFSPRVSLQGMAPYARTVSDEADEARR